MLVTYIHDMNTVRTDQMKTVFSSPCCRLHWSLEYQIFGVFIKCSLSHCSHPLWGTLDLFLLSNHVWGLKLQLRPPRNPHFIHSQEITTVSSSWLLKMTTCMRENVQHVSPGSDLFHWTPPAPVILLHTVRACCFFKKSLSNILLCSFFFLFFFC